MLKKAIAHTRESGKEVQSLWQHLNETAVIAGKFGAKFGMEKNTKLLGMMHDLGKASHNFQTCIKTNSGIENPDEQGDDLFLGKKVDHSTAAAQLLHQSKDESPENKLLNELLANTLASHHSRKSLLDMIDPDGNSPYLARMEKPVESTYLQEITQGITDHERDLIFSLIADQDRKTEFNRAIQYLIEEDDSVETCHFKIGLLNRMLLSCLMDADRLNTADFESQSKSHLRQYGVYKPWRELIQLFETYLENKIRNLPISPQSELLFKMRREVSDACFRKGESPPGIFNLTVPTGGGKTLSSLRFALQHAHVNNLDRICYIIPYTSIIDQNAKVIREIFSSGSENKAIIDSIVLEDHSNLNSAQETFRQSLLAENWDAPIVLTTQVQFLEALFGLGSNNIRRMHQLAKSVIIFDEIQILPRKCLHLFNVALRFLTKSCGSSVVLCSATLPQYDRIKPASRAIKIAPENQIITFQDVLYHKLKRVNTHDARRPEKWSSQDVLGLAMEKISEGKSVLIVVNTKHSATDLYQLAQEMNVNNAYHLSTNMCAAHRLDVLETVKGKLHQGVPVLCVSTQLIEAGIDIDFRVVIRYQAGLDSITQAAGRCNREGLHASGELWIVNPDAENISKLTDIKEGSQKTDWVLDQVLKNPGNFNYDPIGLNALQHYYQAYLDRLDNLFQYPIRSNSSLGREDTLFNLLSSNQISYNNRMRHYKDASSNPILRQAFSTASTLFKVIDDSTRGVIVPYKRGAALITKLSGTNEMKFAYQLIKQAQRYTVNLFDSLFVELANNNIIKEISNFGIYALNEQFYSDKLGVTTQQLPNLSLYIS
ncbi:MAG: CRISPR-associated helicase Cas3' [Anaerolineaceae bacterium]